MKKVSTLLLSATLSLGVCATVASAIEPSAVKRKAEFTEDVSKFTAYDTPSQPRFRPPANYPSAFKGSNVVGYATIAFIVGTDGKPDQVQYLEATDIAFVEPAIEAAKRWRFQPAKKEGHPVRSVVQIMVEVNER